jgi:photosystem II stability/assembly factor-like uncharacterized protein
MTTLDPLLVQNTNRRNTITTFIRMSYVFIVTFSLPIFYPVNATAKTLVQSLEGQIIRSYAFNRKNPNQILVGVKGETSGSGKVYFSENAGETWQLTNSGNALSEASQDVQTVAFLDNKTFLAGTWKNGLFLSNNAGETWQTYPDFPSKDIRAIKLGFQHDSQVYIATTTSWITDSNDLMKSWEQLASKKMASWDLIIDPSNDHVLYALTFSSCVQKSKDGGKTWTQILEMKNNMMIYDLLVSADGTIVAVGSNDTSGIIITSTNGGKHWEYMANKPVALFNSLELVDGNLVVGSWDKGVYKQQDDLWYPLPEIKDIGVTKIKRSGTHIYYFTWGNGVFREQL